MTTKEGMWTAGAPVAPGTRIGRYELLAELGSGGMASVYLARIIGPGTFRKLVALKRIHPHLLERRDVVEMFIDEATLAAQMAHPNICSVIDFGEVEGELFLAMEYLEGAPLSTIIMASVQHLNRAPERWRDYIAFLGWCVVETCKGLQAAHEAVDERGRPLKVVHRDISPDNIYVTYSGLVKIVDFGVAHGQRRIHQTSTGRLKGKFGYLAPETFGDDGFDHRVDIWSLGVVFWEGLCQERLFWNTDPERTVKAIVAGEVIPPSVKNPKVPRVLDSVVLRALERQVFKRWSAASELGDALAGALHGDGLACSEVEALRWLELVLPGHREALKSEVVRALEEKEPSDFTIPRLSLGDAFLGRGRVEEEEALAPTKSLTAPERAVHEELAEAPTALLKVPEAKAASVEAPPSPPVDSMPSLSVDTTPVLPIASSPSPLAAASSSSGAEDSPSSSKEATAHLPRPLFWSLVGVAMCLTAVLFYWVAGFFPPVAERASSELAEVTTDQLSLIHASSERGRRSAAPPDASNDEPSNAERQEYPAVEGSVDAAPAVASADSEPSGEADSGPHPERRARPRRHARRQASPAAQRMGSVRIATPGGWAEVYHGGRRVAAQTPATLRLPEGRQVIFLRFGGSGAQRRVTVEVRVDRAVAVVQPVPR